MMCYPKKAKKGFTLIELLVVISIIALLLSILMPALSKVKEQAKKVVCSSNEHQLGVAFSTYTADHGQHPHRVAWGHWPFGGHVWFPETPPDPRLPAGFSVLFEAGYLGLEEKSFRFLYCPSARKHISYNEVFRYYQMNEHPNGQIYNPDWPNGLDYWHLFTAYSYWGGFADLGPTANPRVDPRLDRLLATKHTDSGTQVLVSDLTISLPAPGGDYSQSEDLDMGWTSHIKNNTIQGGNSLYNDGSVRWLSMKKMQDDWERHTWYWGSTSGAWDFWF